MGLGRFHDGLHENSNAPATAKWLPTVASWFKKPSEFESSSKLLDIGASKAKTAEYGKNEGFKYPMFI